MPRAGLHCQALESAASVRVAVAFFGLVRRIDYTLDAAAEVTFEVTSMTGSIVRRMDLGVQPAGTQRAVLDLEGLTAGMYTYTITVDGARATRKLIIK